MQIPALPRRAPLTDGLHHYLPDLTDHFQGYVVGTQHKHGRVRRELACPTGCVLAEDEASPATPIGSEFGE